MERGNNHDVTSLGEGEYTLRERERERERERNWVNLQLLVPFSQVGFVIKVGWERK